MIFAGCVVKETNETDLNNLQNLNISITASNSDVAIFKKR